jgi:hypothetical protein
MIDERETEFRSCSEGRLVTRAEAIAVSGLEA